MKKVIFMTMMCLVIIWTPLFADESIDSIINKQINVLDLSEPNKAIDQIKEEEENPYLNQFDIKQTMIDMVTGKQSLSPIKLIKGLMTLTFGEMNVYISLMGRLIILAIFCTVLSTLSASFGSKSTSEVAFYMCYIVLILALTESFMVSMNIAYRTIEQMATIMQASIPVMVTLLISTGNIASGSIFQPLVISTIQIGTAVIKNAVLPLVFFVSVLQIVSNLSEDFKIDALVELAYSLIKWILTGIVTLFVGIMGIQGLTAPFVDGTLNKAAKSMTSAFVPVVGEALSGTVDLVMNCGVIVKNSYTVGVIIMLLLICTIPLIKVLLCMVAYQLTAAIIEPISNKRVAQCMEGMGRATGYLLGTLTTVMVLFILNMLILVGVSNITAMMQ
ncbi:MAG TPA: stage III sporulation protein AE [Epulopiscium sp.]|nr:stage III sporulation protein AE [Candidatus Epulonipiscium sp.]